MIQSFNTSQDILNHFKGLDSNTSDVLVKHVMNSEKRIIKKVTTFKFEIKERKKEAIQNYLKLCTINATEVNKIVISCSTIGIAVGGIFSCMFSGALTMNGIIIGGGTGFGVGLGICLKKDLFSQAENEVRTVKVGITKDILEFQNNYSIEHYTLFKNFLKNYIKIVNKDKFEKVFDGLICPLTKFIPDIPVFTPYDELKEHVYDRKAIERHIGIIDARIEEAKLKGANDQEIIDLQRKWYPGGQPFKKNELVTDIRYFNKVIILIKGSLKSIDENFSVGNDPVLKKGLKCLLEHYKNNYKNCSKAIVDNLFDDCISLGTPVSMVKEVCEAFEANFKIKIKSKEWLKWEW